MYTGQKVTGPGTALLRSPSAYKCSIPLHLFQYSSLLANSRHQPSPAVTAPFPVYTIHRRQVLEDGGRSEIGSHAVAFMDSLPLSHTRRHRHLARVRLQGRIFMRRRRPDTIASRFDRTSRAISTPHSNNLTLLLPDDVNLKTLPNSSNL